MSERELNDLERRVVGLLEQGFARWKIAEEVQLGETTVREVIKRLCERYDVASRDLPEAVRKENGGANSKDR